MQPPTLEKTIKEDGEKVARSFFEEMSLEKIQSGIVEKDDSPSLAYDSPYWLGTVSKTRKNIIEEYRCETTVEKIVADQIATCYWRIIELQGDFNEIGHKRLYTIGQDTLKILKEVQRGLQMAEKQLHNSILLLKQLKQPQLNVTIKTENAYVANQQVVNH